MRLESMTLAFSSPEVCYIALALHSAHLFRGRAERRDCVLRAAGRRLAQRNRSALLRSKLCRAYTLQGLRFLRYGCVISADCDEPDGLVSVAGYNPAASTTSPKSLPPARPARAKVVGAVPLFADCARAGVTDISRSILFPSGSCRAYRLACSTFPGIRRHG